MLIFTGDWHSEFDRAYRQIKALDLKDCDIFQVGDFGVGFEKKNKEIRRLNRLNENLKRRNINLYAIRGNHDDPEYFNGDMVFSNITLLKDYSIIESSGKRILCVGGAISIDRMSNPEEKMYNGKSWKGRKEGINYWVNEKFFLKLDELRNVEKIDVVITHSAPGFCHPRIKSGIEKWAKYDNTLIQECDQERADIQTMYDVLKLSNNIEHWFYGHFHHESVEYIDDTKFVLLNIHQFYELRT